MWSLKKRTTKNNNFTLDLFFRKKSAVIIISGTTGVTGMNEGPTWWENWNVIYKIRKKYEHLGQSRGRERCRWAEAPWTEWPGTEHPVPIREPASRMVTHWDLLGGSYMQHSSMLLCRWRKLTLGQWNPLGNTSPAVPASPREQRHLWGKSEEKVKNSFHSSLPIKENTILRNLSLWSQDTAWQT